MRAKPMDRVFLVACGKAPPTEEEWAAYVNLVEAQGVGMAQIILTDGGEPTTRQRQALDRVLDGLPMPTAILSSNRRVRFFVWLLSCFDRTIAGFPADGMRDALYFLEVPMSRAPFYQRELDKLRAEIDDDDPPPVPPAQSVPGVAWVLLLFLAIMLGGGGGAVLIDAAARASTHGRP
jgi:hypothetical protein